MTPDIEKIKHRALRGEMRQCLMNALDLAHELGELDNILQELVECWFIQVVDWTCTRSHALGHVEEVPTMLREQLDNLVWPELLKDGLEDLEDEES